MNSILEDTFAKVRLSEENEKITTNIHDV